VSGEGDPTDDLVPAQLSVTVRRDDRRVEAFDLDELRGRQVEIYANGFTYRGVLHGADEHEIYLKGLTRWWTIPLERVATLRADPEPEDAPPSEAATKPQASSGSVEEEEIAPGLSFDPDEGAP
jgi:hypothetical protein